MGLHIGEKIKKIRLSKLMTQADLAGDHITRNMLSTIERGATLPSLPTVMYIADRLNVPIGYLLCEAEDEHFYRKMASLPNIRQAFAQKDLAGCLYLISALGETADDELSLIRAECEYGMALDAIQKGQLRLGAAALDRALRAVAQTSYDISCLRERIGVCFRYLGGLSTTLASDILDAEEIELSRAFGDTLVEYVMSIEALENERVETAEDYVRRHPKTVYAARLSALLMMREGDYLGAQAALEALLARDELTFGVLLYEVFGDLERCYRENDDYKRAYEFSGSRLTLLERLLEEV
jgi:transcriptional regulator with XRE-family HTH domain